MAGPLQGVKVVEMMGIGPGPFCTMMLADMGAEVLRIARPGWQPDATDVMGRGRTTQVVDLRADGAAADLLKVIAKADVLVEGYRPGVMERLGLGPDVCLQANPGLIYGRMTGWGQHGPLAKAAGHDITYIAISGALHAIGKKGQAPTIPLNYVGDFGGGAMMLAFGITSALYERQHSGKGQVIDAAMTDGTALISAMMYGMKAAGQWSNDRGQNLLDGGAFFYNTYACADGRYLAVGPIEPQFYALFRQHSGIADDTEFDAQNDEGRWPELTERLAAVIKTKTRDEWCRLMDGTDACIAPVLDWDEAPLHPHNVARGTFTQIDGVTQPAPAPRFSRTPAAQPVGASSRSVEELRQHWGVDS